jgi:hypothetical protein
MLPNANLRPDFDGCFTVEQHPSHRDGRGRANATVNAGQHGTAAVACDREITTVSPGVSQRRSRPLVRL